MNHKKITLVSLASALVAIAPAAQATVSNGTASPEMEGKIGREKSVGRPNSFYNFGEDLMGLVTSTTENGTVVSQHYSHASHASHASHYSGR